jgi:hypothetical protein
MLVGAYEVFKRKIANAIVTQSYFIWTNYRPTWLGDRSITQFLCYTHHKGIYTNLKLKALINIIIWFRLLYVINVNYFFITL